MENTSKDTFNVLRQELKKAENLLKQRAANTKILLSKQNALLKDVEKEKHRRKEAEKALKEKKRENDGLKSRVDSLEVRVEKLEQLLLQHSSDGAILTEKHASKKHGVQGSGKNTISLHPGEDKAADEDRVATNKKRKCVEDKKKPDLKQQQKTWGKTGTVSSQKSRPILPDNKQSTQVQEKRKIDVHVLVLKAIDQSLRLSQDTVAARIDKVHDAISNAMHVNSNQSIDSAKIIKALVSRMMECCAPMHGEKLAPVTWSPCAWYHDSTTADGPQKGMQQMLPFSLISMWCDIRAIEGAYLPTMLKLLYDLDMRDTSWGLSMTMMTTMAHGLHTGLADLIHGRRGTLALTEMCGLSTMLMAMYRMYGRAEDASKLVWTLFIATLQASLDTWGGRCSDKNSPSIVTRCSVVLPFATAVEVWPDALIQTVPTEDIQHLHAFLALFLRVCKQIPSVPVYGSSANHAAQMLYDISSLQQKPNIESHASDMPSEHQLIDKLRQRYVQQ